jgi:putative nucleotidyltransferase with HDIG domain
VEPDENKPRRRPAALIALAALAGSAAWFAALDHAAMDDGVVIALLALAVVGEVAAVRFESRLNISGADSCYLVALGIAGPAPAVMIAVVSMASGWVVERYRKVSLAVNLAGVAVPVLAAGALFDAIAPGGQDSDWFIPALLAATIVALVGNLAVVVPLMALQDGVSVRSLLPAVGTMRLAFGFQAAFVVAIAGVYARFGVEASAAAVVAVLAYAYMTRLVIHARDRAREYANLSWGVLSGLIRTLDQRDHRAARHCAAVARFSRDIARAAGMSRREQELAHTAGLLHDIGRFVLSDRVMDRDAELTGEDWRAIRKHPEIGAELLRDIGVYGPVADIIRAHHERPDGKGYPRRLAAEEIPPIARIVAVAEVYDTLTAPDTYRTQMNSFEALTELRRVAGTQLDATYVEILADLLAGQGTEYRHADDADFDRELDIERRMNEAAAP